jgi:hypothetical protein
MGDRSDLAAKRGAPLAEGSREECPCIQRAVEISEDEGPPVTATIQRRLLRGEIREPRPIWASRDEHTQGRIEAERRRGIITSASCMPLGGRRCRRITPIAVGGSRCGAVVLRGMHSHRGPNRTERSPHGMGASGHRGMAALGCGLAARPWQGQPPAMAAVPELSD